MEAGLQNKIESIQVFRFFAAFSVMLVHMPIFEFGHWGVDIFFVISGFIMMYITEKNNNYFLIKRFIRIIPLYWILTLGVFAIAALKPEYLNNTTANLEDLIKWRRDVRRFISDPVNDDLIDGIYVLSIYIL